MRHAARLAAFLLLAAPATAEPFQHSSGEWREYFRDWLAACPSVIDEDATDYYGRACFASTGSQALNSSNLPAYKLTLIRDRLNGQIDVAITVATDVGEYDEARPIEIAFGGDQAVALKVGETLETRSNVINQFFVSDAAVRDNLLDRMKQRTSLRLIVPIEGSDVLVDSRLSLQGVMASLDFMSTHARKVAQY